jgi:hypothetical protein
MDKRRREKKEPFFHSNKSYSLDIFFGIGKGGVKSPFIILALKSFTGPLIAFCTGEEMN